MEDHYARPASFCELYRAARPRGVKGKARPPSYLARSAIMPDFDPAMRKFDALCADQAP
jgi:hypothetical protein